MLSKKPFFYSLLIALSCAYACAAADLKRPNILLAIADDVSWQDFGCYGSTFVETPTFDSLAEAGVQFNNAFCSAPGCSPSRAALLTGKHIWEIEEAGTHASNFPAHLKVYPELLERAGYFTGYTGKPWGPGNWKFDGRTQNPAGAEYNELKFSKDALPATGISTLNYAANFKAFLNEKPKGQPFCFWFGAKEAHRGFEFKSGIKNGKQLADVVVPAFLPDTETIRHDLLDYAVEVEWYDSQMAEMLEILDEAGELENTIIVITADNGMAFPRAKANNYEYGVRMPLIISWPAKFPADRVTDDPVSLIDLAPTFLELADVPVPETMSGRSLTPILQSDMSGTVEPSREYVLSGRERHTHARDNNWGYPIRAMHSAKYTYIRNLKPERSPTGREYKDVDNGPTHQFMLKDLNSPHAQMSYGQRPEEELYDRVNDPYCLQNLAEKPEYRATLDAMWQTLKDELYKAGDPRILGYGVIWESYPRYSRMRDYTGFNDSGMYNAEYVQEAIQQMQSLGIDYQEYLERSKRQAE